MTLGLKTSVRSTRLTLKAPMLNDFIQKKSGSNISAVTCHFQEYYNEFHNGT